MRLIADEIVKKQRDDGSWDFFLSRPPVNESQATDAVWIILALQGEIGPDAAESHRVALEKGIAWLSGAKLPDNHQGKVLPRRRIISRSFDGLAKSIVPSSENKSYN